MAKPLAYLLTAIWVVSCAPAVTAQVPDSVRGIDIASAINVFKEDVKAEARLFIPDRVARVRAVIVVTDWGLGGEFYGDSELRKLIEESGLALCSIRLSPIKAESDDVRPILTKARLTSATFDAFLTALQRLATESDHPELAHSPLLFWGHSRAGNVGAAFALAYPERTVGFVLYQSAAAGVLGDNSDLTPVAKIPALIIEGIVDAPGDPKASENFWKRGRTLRAPWAFLTQPAPHGSSEFRKAANSLLIPWIRAVVNARIGPDGALKTVNDGTGWVGNNETREIIASAPSPTSQKPMSWLPDEVSARAWRDLFPH